MLSSIRARVVLACVALVVFSVVSSTATDYSIAKASMEATIDHDLTSSANDHSAAIGEWIAGKTRMVSSLQDVVLAADPGPMLKQIAVAGGFFDVGVGYPDRTAKFTDWPNIPPSYDPTSRPWYKSAVQAGKSVALPYVSTSGALLVALAIPVIRDGVLKAVLMGDVALDSVIENVKSIHPTPASFGILIDRSGGHELHASSPPHTFCHLLDIHERSPYAARGRSLKSWPPIIISFAPGLAEAHRARLLHFAKHPSPDANAVAARPSCTWHRLAASQPIVA